MHGRIKNNPTSNKAIKTVYMKLSENSKKQHEHEANLSGFPLLKIEKFLELHIHNPLVQPHNTISTSCERVIFQLNISE